MRGFFRTQWIQPIGSTVIPTDSELNLFTLISDANKSANGCDTDYNSLSVSTDKIIVPYKGVMTHEIRISVNIDVGTIQTYYVQLRRYADNSVIASQRFQRNPDIPIDTQLFSTYTGNPTDPFVTGGFYIAFLNESGSSVTLSGNINLYIKTTVR